MSLLATSRARATLRCARALPSSASPCIARQPGACCRFSLSAQGFPISFNAITASFNMDFRQNMLFYDLTNDVIIDKTGHGVEDVCNRVLRLSCAEQPGETHEQWAAATITPGFKELRYIKFVLRAEAKGEPMTLDKAETEFVVRSLKAAMQSNASALRGFWFGYALEKQLQSAEGIAALHGWVLKHGGTAGWWEADWAPLVQAAAPTMTAVPATSAAVHVRRPAARVLSRGAGRSMLPWRRATKIARTRPPAECVI